MVFWICRAIPADLSCWTMAVWLVLFPGALGVPHPIIQVSIRKFPRLFNGFPSTCHSCTIQVSHCMYYF